MQDWRTRFALIRAPDGTRVAEADLRHGGPVSTLIEEAREAGAQKLWVHATAIDAELGFRRSGGYARLEANRPIVKRVDLATPPYEIVRRLQLDCFAGVWGRHEPSELDPSDTFVGLHEAGAWIGICELEPAARWIDGPGVIAGLRTPDRYARLVRGAAALLSAGPVALETWGDSEETIESYVQLGFEVVEYVPGWELVL